MSALLKKYFLPICSLIHISQVLTILEFGHLLYGCTDYTRVFKSCLECLHEDNHTLFQGQSHIVSRLSCNSKILPDKNLYLSITCFPYLGGLSFPGEQDSPCHTYWTARATHTGQRVPHIQDSACHTCRTVQVLEQDSVLCHLRPRRLGQPSFQLSCTTPPAHSSPGPWEQQL